MHRCLLITALSYLLKITQLGLLILVHLYLLRLAQKISN